MSSFVDTLWDDPPATVSLLLGGSSVATFVPYAPKFDYIGIGGKVLDGQAVIVSSSFSWEVSGGVVLSAESLTVYENRYYSSRTASGTVTITDQTELNAGDKVTLRATSAPSTDIDFIVDPDDPASATVTITDQSELNTGDKVTLRSTSAPSTDIDFSIDPDVAASGRVTITDYAQLNIGDKVTLLATSAPSTDIDFIVAVDGSGWNPGASNDAAAFALANLINANSNFAASAVLSVVTITQSTAGAAGNTTIALTDAGVSGMSKLDFNGGVDGPGWDAGNSNDGAASSLATLVNANANFSASANSAVVTITQSTGGAAGNTTVTLTDSGAAGMSKSDFTGGAAGSWDLGSSNNDAASALATFIDANANFSASADSAVVTITQSPTVSQLGASGNTTVVLTDSGNAGMSKSDFSGGVDSAVSGGMVLGGLSNVISTQYSFSGSGGIQSSGSLDEHWFVNPYITMFVTSSGGIDLGGSSGAYISNYVGVGGLELGGTAGQLKSDSWLYTGNEGAVLSGQAQWVLSEWSHSSSGGISLGGEYYPAFNVVGNDVSRSDQYADTFASDATLGTVDWVSPSNAAADDDQEASVALSGGVISKYLKSTNFGFSIPSNETIMGVRIIVDKRANSQGSIKDESVRLVKDGSIQGDDKVFSPSPWPAMVTNTTIVTAALDDGYVTYDPSSDSYSMNSAAAVHRLGASMQSPGLPGSGKVYQNFMRLQNVFVPQGAKITSAKLTLIVAENYNANGQTAKIYANDTDDSIQPLTAYAVTGAVPTTSNVTFTFDATQSGTIESPDISSIVQELVDRDGWSSGNSMTLYFREAVYAGTDWYMNFDAFGQSQSVFLEIIYYSPAVVEYGDFDDTWDLDLTYDDVNDSTFGMVISAKNDMPSIVAGSVSAFIDYIKASIYHLKIGVIIGGTADYEILNRIAVGEGGFVISGSAVVVSGSHSWVGTGGLVLSGNALPYFEDLTTFIKYDVFVSDFDVFFEETTRPAHVVSVSDVVTLCGCDPINPIINLNHNLTSGSKLGSFINRNSFSLPSNIKLIYNSAKGSWKSNFHYVDVDKIEIFDVLFEWSCVGEIGDNNLGYNAWKFSILVNYENRASGVYKDTRILLVFPKGHFCSVGQRLDASFEINTQGKTSIITETSSFSKSSFVVDTIINDGVGLFKNNYWTQNPNLEIKVEESISTLREFYSLDFEPILPEDEFVTTVEEGGILIDRGGLESIK